MIECISDIISQLFFQMAFINEITEALLFMKSLRLENLKNVTIVFYLLPDQSLMETLKWKVERLKSVCFRIIIQTEKIKEFNIRH